VIVHAAKRVQNGKHGIAWLALITPLRSRVVEQSTLGFAELRFGLAFPSVTFPSVSFRFMSLRNDIPWWDAGSSLRRCGW
jgi:hypothetical protein